MSPDASVTRSRLHGARQAVVGAFGIIGQYPVLIPLALITLFAQMSFSGANNVTLLNYVSSLGVSKYWEGRITGYILATFLLAETFLRVPFGWLSDRYGRTPLIVGALCITVPAFLFAAFVPHYGWLFPAFAVVGMMAAALWPSIFALVGDMVPQRLRANAMGVINMMYMLALFSGWGLAAALHERGARPSSFFFFGAGILGLGGVVAALFFRLRPQFHKPHPEVHLEDAEHAVMEVAHHAVLLTITFLQTLAITLLAPFMFKYVSEDLGFGLGKLAVLVGAPVIGVALFAIPLSRLADTIGKVAAVRIAFAAIAVTLWLFSAYHSLPVLAVTAMIIGVAFSMGVPAWLAILSSLGGSKARGVTLAGYGTIQGMASVCGPLLAGQIWDHYSHVGIFMASALSLTIAAILAWSALPASLHHSHQGEYNKG